MKTAKFKIIFCISLFSSLSTAQTQPPSNVEIVATTGPSVNESAMATSNQQGMGQIMSMLQGSSHIQSGRNLQRSCCSGDRNSCCSQMAMQYGLGALSFAQAKQHAATSGAAGFTGALTSGTGTGSSYSDPYSEVSGRNPLTADSGFKAAVGIYKDLKNSGVINEKNGTINTPTASYKVSDFSSAAKMSAAGFSKGAIDGAMEFAKKASKAAEDKAKNLKLGSLSAVTGFDEGSGSKGSALSESSEVSSGAGFVKAAAPLDRDPSSLAGMQKNYNGEPIGIAADSIFLMMNRRYKVKESQDSFYNEMDISLQK